jgi:hypothetical protein
MVVNNGKIFAVSILASILISGCVPQGAALNVADLNISKNSIMIEHENIKSATAILIKKSEGYDRFQLDQKNMALQINESNSRYQDLLNKNDDLRSRLSIVSDEVGYLKNEIETLKAKHFESLRSAEKTIIDENKSISINNSPGEIIAPAIPKVTTIKLSAEHVPLNNKKKKAEPDLVTSTSNKTNHTQSKKPPIHTIVAPAVSMSFQDSEGKVIVNRPNVFVRTAPELTVKSKSENVGEGDVFTYVAKNKDWYRLKSGAYISSHAVVDLTTVKSKK